MSDAAELLAQAREHGGITRDELAIRARFTTAFVVAVEASRQEPSLEQLAELLLACGHVMERSVTNGALAVRPAKIDADEPTSTSILPSSAGP